jgi:hypothetical protein
VLLIIDEAARVSDEMYRTLRPMLASTNGDLWMMSTPCGKRGFSYHTWTNGAKAGFGNGITLRLAGAMDFHPLAA